MRNKLTLLSCGVRDSFIQSVGIVLFNTVGNDGIGVKEFIVSGELFVGIISELVELSLSVLL